MSLLSWAKQGKSDTALDESHRWVLYANPRNQKIAISACANCGALKGATSDPLKCVNSSSRASNMLAAKGWVEERVAS